LHRLRHLAETEEAPVLRKTFVVAHLDVVADEVRLIPPAFIDRTVARRAPLLEHEDALSGQCPVCTKAR